MKNNLKNKDSLSGKFDWSYFAFVGTGMILLLILIGLLLSPQINFFSVFNIGRILGGIFLIPFFIYLSNYLEKKGSSKDFNFKLFYYLTLLFGLITAISLTLGGLFTMQSAPIIHIVSGALFNFGIVFLCLFCGLLEYKIPEIPRKYAVSGFIVSPLPIIFMIFFLFSNLMGLSEDIMFIFEWISFFAFIAWIMNQGFYILKNS